MQIEYKILWLDDHIEDFIDDEYVDEIKKYIEDEGFDAVIETVDNATDFFSKLDKSYDLILTDYHMEEMNGDRVVEQIRNTSKIFSEILFYTARADLKDICKIDRVSFLQTDAQNDIHEKAVTEKIKSLISLTIQKFHDIVVMRGMIMHETSNLDKQQLEILKTYIEKVEVEKTNGLKDEILNEIQTHFDSKINKINIEWKVKPNGLKLLMKDNYVFSAEYKIKTLSWILQDLTERDFSSEYQEDIIQTRNKFAHAVLEEELDDHGKVVRKYFKHGETGLTFDEALCKTIRMNIKKHKVNLKSLKDKL